MLGALDRLKLARELAGTIGTLKSETDVLRRVALAKKVSSLRGILTGKQVNSIAALDLHAGPDTVRVLQSYWDGLKNAPELERMRASKYLRIVSGYMNGVARATSDGSGAGTIGLGRLVAEIGDIGDKPDARMRMEFDTFNSYAPDVHAMLEGDAAAALRELDVMTQVERDITTKMSAACKPAYDELDRATGEISAKFRAQKITMDEYATLRAQIVEKRDVAIEAATADLVVMRDSNREARRLAELRTTAPAADLKRNVLAASPVTEEQAFDWARNQRIESSGMAALKKIGYDANQVRADMAEFYRLTGGRLSKVRIKASRGRASAEGIHGHKNRTINMGAGFCKRTLFHELGHHLEADPGVFAAARAFLVKRRESDTVYRLRDLTGNSAYKRDEAAYKDAWFNPYVGKHYNYDVTEVMSMGVESWCDDATLAARMQADPEHMKLIAGFMKAPPHPLMAAVKKVLAQAAETEDEAADGMEIALEEGLKKLAAGVEFVKATPPDGLDEIQLGVWKMDQPKEPYWLKNVTLIGSYKGLHLWQSDKVRDPATKRQKKGFVIAQMDDPGVYIRLWYPAFSMDEAKAMARVWAEEGQGRYLTDYKRVQQLVQTMGAA